MVSFNGRWFLCLLGWKSVENVPKLVAEYMSKKIKVDEFVTHTLPFDKINEAFELMHAGKRSVFLIAVTTMCFYQWRSLFYLCDSLENNFRQTLV